MLLHYRFENFKSFKEPVEFDMLAPGNKVKNRFPDNFVSASCGEDVLKTAVIVGENAGGKTNFIDSLKFLRGLLVNNSKVRAMASLINRANLSDSKSIRDSDTHQKFDLEVLAADGCIYRYVLAMDGWGLQAEKLGYRTKKGGADRLVYAVERNGGLQPGEGDRPPSMNFDVRISQAEVSADIVEYIEKQVLTVSYKGLLAPKLAVLDVPHVAPFYQWIEETLCLESVGINYDLYHQIMEDEDDRRVLEDKRYLEIFRLIDSSVVAIELDEEKLFQDSVIVRQDAQGNLYKRKLKADSTGVREFFAWAIQLFRVVYENKVVLADEMDRVLNPILSDRVIAFIHGKKHQGQFIFTTHNVLHLNLNTYMKEQLYFITRDNDSLESTLYSLADFPDVRYDNAKMYEFYLKGILGGTAF